AAQTAFCGGASAPSQTAVEPPRPAAKGATVCWPSGLDLELEPQPADSLPHPVSPPTRSSGPPASLQSASGLNVLVNDSGGGKIGPLWGIHCREERNGKCQGCAY